MKWARLPMLLAALAAAHSVANGAQRTPVILVTDIGSDIDDSWALALALRSPELDLKLVLTDPADTPYRSAVAAKFLDLAGHGGVPIGIGDNSGPMGDDSKTLTPWIAGYDVARYPGKIYTDGIAALIDVVEKSRVPVTIIAIGPMHSLAALSAPWRDVLLTPLDTCGSVSLDGERYHAIWSATGDPMLRALIESYCIFAPRQTWMKCDYFATRSTTLFDCVAVYLAYSEELVETETISFEVTDDGFTRRSMSGPFRARVAIRWKNRDGFEAQLAGRLLGH